jgi:hypothetical protein
MSTATEQKAQRLLSEGRVEPDPLPAKVFRVQGDTGIYVVVVSAHYRACNCEAGQHGAHECSHVKSCISWVLAEGARARGDESRFSEYEQALAARKARDAAEAEKLFERLS